MKRSRAGDERPRPADAVRGQSAAGITMAASMGSKLASRCAKRAVASAGIFSSFILTTRVDLPRCTV